MLLFFSCYVLVFVIWVMGSSLLFPWGDVKSFLILVQPTIKRGLAILVNKFKFTHHAFSLDAIKEKPMCRVAVEYYRILQVWLVLLYSSTKSFYNTHTHTHYYTIAY